MTGEIYAQALSNVLKLLHDLDKESYYERIEILKRWGRLC